MRRPSWWKETGRLRLVLVATATAIALLFLFVLPALSEAIGDRAAALMRPSIALAVLAGLLLFGHDRLTVLHRHHDKGGD